jgi:hypothetical protein
MSKPLKLKAVTLMAEIEDWARFSDLAASRSLSISARSRREEADTSLTHQNFAV